LPEGTREATRISTVAVIDQICILRDGGDDPVDSQTVWEFFCEVKSVLERVDMVKVIKLPGKLLVF
jgi:hypothetical protein